MSDEAQPSVPVSKISLTAKVRAVFEHVGWLWTAFSFIGGILSAFLAAHLYLGSYIKHEVKVEVDRQMNPVNMWNRADNAFTINREQEGFDYMDQAILLYQQEGLDGKVGLAALLGDYMFRLSNVENPIFFENQMANVKRCFLDNRISPTPCDQNDEAWFWLLDRQLNKAKSIYIELNRNLTPSNDSCGVRPYVLRGLGLCALAEGNTSEAHGYLTEAYRNSLPDFPTLIVGDKLYQDLSQMYPAYSNAVNNLVLVSPKTRNSR